jgi:HEAT repeat protein
MTPETLTAQVQSGASDAIATASKMGASAVPTLKKLLEDPDPDVRLMTIRCFDAVGGDDAIEAGVRSLLDEDSQVASRAAVLLHNHPPRGQGAKLFAAFNHSTEVAVRVEIPKIAGRIGDENDIRLWTTALPLVKEPEVRDGVQIGLAKMGHEPSRDWFKLQLAAADGPPALPWLEAAEYMADPWVVPTLAKLLDKRSEVYTAAADFEPVQVRVCDIAAYVIFTITKHKVEFRVSKRRYLETEIDEARKAAAQPPAAP